MTIVAKGAEVSLTLQEYRFAASIGMNRRATALFNGYKDRYGADKDPESLKFYRNVSGALSEKAFSKLTGLQWNLNVKYDPKACDVNPNWQVRCSAFDRYRLLIRPHEGDDFNYAFLIGDGHKYTYCGWMLGRDAKQKQWLDTKADRPAAYFVPQNALHSEIHLTD